VLLLLLAATAAAVTAAVQAAAATADKPKHTACSRWIHLTAALQLLQCAVCWLNLSITTVRGSTGPRPCLAAAPGQGIAPPAQSWYQLRNLMMPAKQKEMAAKAWSHQVYFTLQTVINDELQPREAQEGTISRYCSYFKAAAATACCDARCINV
jgi:hypothetical protein